MIIMSQHFNSIFFCRHSKFNMASTFSHSSLIFVIFGYRINRGLTLKLSLHAFSLRIDKVYGVNNNFDNNSPGDNDDIAAGVCILIGK